MHTLKLRLYGALLTAGMAVSGINLVLLAPFLGLWVGSRFTGDSSISVLAVAVTAAVTLAVGLVWAIALGRLGEAHDRLRGRPRVVQRHTPWLRSLSGERVNYPGSQLPAMSTLDYVLVVLVFATAIAFEIWFFFYSGSPFDQRTGRE